MCTLIIGNAVLGPGCFVVAANRDENLSRPSEPPRVLASRPLVVGGRDRIAAGTWLAVRDGRAVVAVLNRRPAGGRAPRQESRAIDHNLRSRGLLALDVAVADPDASPREFSASALAEAEHSVREHRYAPFTLACITEHQCWVMSFDGAAPARVDAPTPGWHVVTHADLDDASEPRTVRLLRALQGLSPAGPAEAEARMLELLSLHGEREAPPVCIHEGPMVTVSSSVIVRTPRDVRYAHVEGRPCTMPASDLAALLAGTERADRPSSAALDH